MKLDEIERYATDEDSDCAPWDRPVFLKLLAVAKAAKLVHESLFEQYGTQYTRLKKALEELEKE